jgi:RHS repeat-associated protein
MTAFGESSGTMRLGFPGQVSHGTSGLVYNYHRDYDATTGRYVSEDPLRYSVDPNFYLYAKNSPVSYFDNDGLKYCGTDKKPFDISNRNTVICENGRLKPVVNKCKRLNPEDTCKVCDCAMAHERHHIKQAQGETPCKDRKDTFAPKFNNASQREEEAYEIELKCYLRKMNSRDCYPGCKGVLCGEAKWNQCIRETDLYSFCEDSAEFENAKNECLRRREAGVDDWRGCR